MDGWRQEDAGKRDGGLVDPYTPTREMAQSAAQKANKAEALVSHGREHLGAVEARVGALEDRLSALEAENGVLHDRWVRLEEQPRPRRKAT